MSFVTLDAVINEASLYIINSTDEDKNIFKTFAYRALQDLGISQDDIKVCQILAKNLIIPKPDDMRQFIELALYDVNGYYIRHTFHEGKKRIYPDARIFPAATGTDNDHNCVPVDVSEDRKAFYIGTNGGNVSYALVRYWAYPIDDQGQPLFREEEVQAIIYYIRYAMAMRKNDNRSEIAQNQEAWFHESDRCKAKKKTVSNELAKTLAGTLNRMIPKFNRSKF